MLKEKDVVVFYQSPQQELNKLLPEWKKLQRERKFWQADQMKHRISFLKRLVKHGRK